MSQASPVICHACDMDAVARLRTAAVDACYFTTRDPHKSTLNEDSLGLSECDASSAVFMVADGLGGMRKGDAASHTLVQHLSNAVTAQHGNCEQLRETVLDGIEQAHADILARYPGAATTLALLQVNGHTVRPYHVGDSAVLVTGQRGKLKHLSVAHSPVGYAMEAGVIDEQEAIHHEDRHLVLNAVGIDPMHIEIGPVIELAQYDTVLIASDGVFDNLHSDEIIELIRKGELSMVADSLRQAVTRRMLESRVGEPSKPDDMTFILLRPA